MCIGQEFEKQRVRGQNQCEEGGVQERIVELPLFHILISTHDAE